jgi:hypothetical protein
MATAARPKSVASATTFGNFDNDVINWEALEGALLVIKPKELVRGVSTEHGTKNAMYADVLVCDGDLAGTEYRDTMVFPLTLVGQLQRKPLNQSQLGRLGKGKIKVDPDTGEIATDPETGEPYSAPWKFLPHTPEDVEIAIALTESRKPRPVR